LFSFRGQKEIVALLLSYNADVNPRDKYGQTPLHMAAANGHREVVELLLAKEADANAESDGATPARYAASSGHAAIAELLRSHETCSKT